MKYGAGYIFAKNNEATILDPRKYAVGSIKKAFELYPNMEKVVPSLGYYGSQLKDLEKTISRSSADYVISGTPIDLLRILKIKLPIISVSYEINETDGSLESIIKNFLK